MRKWDMGILDSSHFVRGYVLLCVFSVCVRACEKNRGKVVCVCVCVFAKKNKKKSVLKNNQKSAAISYYKL